MMSLFTSFDLFYFYKVNLIFFILFLVLFNSIFRINFFLSLVNSIFGKLGMFFYSLKPKMFCKTSILGSFIMFLVLFMVNILSVFSFNFPLTSQFGLIMSVSLGMWGSFVLFSVFKNMKGFISHCIPEGTPIPLIVFLFLIELISNFIRPLTLTVRLVANILAGHLLMILLSKLAMLNILGFLFYTLLNMVEIVVALIQAYIFTTMLVLYFSEVH